MTHDTPEVEHLSSIKEVLTEHCGAYEDGEVAALERALIEREQERMDMLAMTGVSQFGLHPQIVAFVLSHLELGEPQTDEQKTLLHDQFHTHMEWMQRAYEAMMRGEEVPPEPGQADSGL